MLKIYQMEDTYSSRLAIRLTLEDKESKTVIFESKRKNGILLFETADKAVQRALENSKYVKEGRVHCVGVHGQNQVSEPEDGDIGTSSPDDLSEYPEDGDIGTSSPDDLSEYPEVVKYSEAKAVLCGEPYNVGKTDPLLKTPDGILKKASELGVSFPNLPSVEA